MMIEVGEKGGGIEKGGGRGNCVKFSVLGADYGLGVWVAC